MQLQVGILRLYESVSITQIIEDVFIHSSASIVISNGRELEGNIVFKSLSIVAATDCASCTFQGGDFIEYK